MNHASLFSGIGGFDLAAEWMNWENVFSCEFAEFPQSVLKYYFTTTEHYGDIKQLNGTKYRGKIDVLTGGFPCQPFSAAGKRKGTEDNRFLWPEMLRVIREVQPTWVVAENVRGIVSIDRGLVFERVHTELEANGYEVQTFCIPACAVDAPHKRDRVWFIAHTKGIGTRRESCEIYREDWRQNNEWLPYPLDTSTGSSTNGAHEQRERRECGGSSGGKSEAPAGNGNRNASNTEGLRWNYGKAKDERKTAAYVHTLNDENGLSKGWYETWIQAATRLCRVDDGLPRELDGITVPKWRRESLKAYGNAIVPQIAFTIFQAIQNAEQLCKSKRTRKVG